MNCLRALSRSIEHVIFKSCNQFRQENLNNNISTILVHSKVEIFIRKKFECRFFTFIKKVHIKLFNGRIHTKAYVTKTTLCQNQKCPSLAFLTFFQCQAFLKFILIFLTFMKIKKKLKLQHYQGQDISTIYQGQDTSTIYHCYQQQTVVSSGKKWKHPGHFHAKKNQNSCILNFLSFTTLFMKASGILALSKTSTFKGLKGLIL